MANEGTEKQPESTESSADNRPTAGQRLAAAKAAKAAKKAAERGRQAELTERKALESAAAARDWMQEHIKTLLAISAAVIVVAGAVFAWGAFSTQRYSTAAALLAEAMDISQAEIDAGGSAEEGTYDSPAARNEAALLKFRAAIDEAPDSPTAAWAHLGEARALYELGQVQEARAAYQAALQGAKDEAVSWFALEGLAYTYESEEAYDQALQQLEALRALSDYAAPIAQYHQGRLLMVQGEADAAKEKLQGVLTLLQEAGAPAMPHTKAQTEARLAVLEPGRPRTPSFDPNQLQQLLQLQNQTPQ